ncbi:MAG TPA: hypothetical protein VI248_20690 [Kineosporiaceae bacterium]
MATDSPSSTALSPDEQAELRRLRAEVARLRELTQAAPRGHRQGRLRRATRITVATILIMVSCVLAPLSVAAVWLRSELTDTNRYVETVEPLAKDPAIQQAITTNLTNVVFTYVDVQGLTKQALSALAERGTLPPDVATRLGSLAVPLAAGVRSFTQDRILQVVQTDVFAQAWVQANRSAHEQLVAALTGDTSGGVKIEGNAVKVDLAAFLNVVKQQLVAKGFELAARIPEVNATFVVFESADVGRVQRLFSLLDTLGFWLPLVLVFLAALGIYLAPNHRVAFIAAGCGVALSMLVGGFVLAWARHAYLNGVPPDALPSNAAATLFDTVVRFLREGLRAAFLIGLFVALGAFLTGPSVTATAIRRMFVAGFAALRGWLADVGVPLSAATRWVAPRARMLRAIVVTGAFLVLLLERYRTPELVGWTTAGVLAALAVIEFLAVEPRRRRASMPQPSMVPAG